MVVVFIKTMAQFDWQFKRYFTMVVVIRAGRFARVISWSASTVNLACVAGLSKNWKAQEGNETASECKNKEQGEGVRRNIMSMLQVKVKNDHRSKFANLSHWKEEAMKSHVGSEVN